MILTDIAKEYFRKWIKENDYPVSLWALEDGLIWKSVEYALIIERLDTVFMPITITNEYYDGYYFAWNINTVNPEYSPNGYDTRLEATEATIEKANEIYNSQHFAQ